MNGLNLMYSVLSDHCFMFASEDVRHYVPGVSDGQLIGGEHQG